MPCATLPIIFPAKCVVKRGSAKYFGYCMVIFGHVIRVFTILTGKMEEKWGIADGFSGAERETMSFSGFRQQSYSLPVAIQAGQVPLCHRV